MNELQMIEAMLDTPGPSDAVVHAGRAKLASAPRRGRRRYAWFATGGLLGLAAAATAIVVVTSGSPAPGRTPHGPPPSGSPESARQILLAAAEQVERQPATTGRFWHIESRSAWLHRAGTPANSYSVTSGRWEDSWLARDPVNGTSWSWERDLGTLPTTPADEAAWKKAGSPKQPPMISMNKIGPIGPAGKVTGGKVDPTGVGDKIYSIGGVKNVSMKELLALPADPVLLKKHLLSIKKSYPETADVAKETNAWLFDAAGSLLTMLPAKPAVRAAAFRLLSKLDAVTVISDVRDADGRKGTAVAIAPGDLQERALTQGPIQERLIVEPGTGRVLAQEYVAVKKARSTAGFPVGTRLSYTVFKYNGWTNDEPRT